MHCHDTQRAERYDAVMLRSWIPAHTTAGRFVALTLGETVVKQTASQ